MKKNVISLIAVILFVAVAISSCGTASSMRKSRIGCPSTRFSIGY